MTPYYQRILAEDAFALGALFGVALAVGVVAEGAVRFWRWWRDE